MTENELAIEQGLRAEVTEAFMGGLKKLFIESNINVPDDSSRRCSRYEREIR